MSKKRSTDTTMDHSNIISMAACSCPLTVPSLVLLLITFFPVIVLLIISAWRMFYFFSLFLFPGLSVFPLSFLHMSTQCSLSASYSKDWIKSNWTSFIFKILQKSPQLHFISSLSLQYISLKSLTGLHSSSMSCPSLQGPLGIFRALDTIPQCTWNKCVQSCDCPQLLYTFMESMVPN